MGCSGETMKRFLAVVCVLLAGVLFAAGPVSLSEAAAQKVEEGAVEERAPQEGEGEQSGAKRSRAAKGDVRTVKIAILLQEMERPIALTELDPFYTDLGVQGARLGVEDNNTTGRFTKQHFEPHEATVPIGGDVAAAFKALVADGHRHVVTVQIPAEDILRLADLPEAKDVLIYNASARDDRLRNEDCRANVVHLVPSRAMLADALAQYLVRKRWKRWFLVVGSEKEDPLYAEAVRRAAKRFGGKIVKEKTWEYTTADVRRTAQAEIPVFTQGVKYDVLIVADEVGWFGDYLLYRTWDPRPVAGTQGLVPTAWHETHERWGSVQMQNRFRRTAGRPMTPFDYAAWTAVRAIGESATRTNSVELEKIRDYMLGPKFVVAAFKGLGVSFRPWNNQLRQPILLAEPKSIVSVSPQEGFLHPVSESDTLGYDEPETACKFK
jgi:ABC transporter substrate binding protein (PQQ-dependent alcohol dehydrogenase system)